MRIAVVFVMGFMGLIGVVGAQGQEFPFQVLLLNISNNGGQQVTVKYKDQVRRITEGDFAKEYQRVLGQEYSYFKKQKKVLYNGNPLEDWPLDYFHGIEEKAWEYYRALVETAPKDTVLMGFSQYGLMARRMTQIDQSFADQGKIPRRRIIGLVTLMTPHQGAPVFQTAQLAPVYYRALGALAPVLARGRFEDLQVMLRSFTGEAKSFTGLPGLDRLLTYGLGEPFVRAFGDFGILGDWRSAGDQENLIKGLESLKGAIQGVGAWGLVAGPVLPVPLERRALDRMTAQIDQLVRDLRAFGKGTDNQNQRDALDLDLVAFFGALVSYFITEGNSNFLSIGWMAYQALRLEGNTLEITHRPWEFPRDLASAELFRASFDMKSPDFDSPAENPFWDPVQNTNFIGTLNKFKEKPLPRLNLIGHLSDIPPVLMNLELVRGIKDPREAWAGLLSQGKAKISDGMIPENLGRYPQAPEGLKEFVLEQACHLNFHAQVYPEVTEKVDAFLESLISRP